jgi:hypothetical protein
MTRIPRFHLVLCIVAICALVSAPLASARPLDRTSQAVQRTDDGWLQTALKWVEDLVGLGGPTSDRTTSSPAPMQKTNNPTGGSCLDPHGNQYCGG